MASTNPPGWLSDKWHRNDLKWDVARDMYTTPDGTEYSGQEIHRRFGVTPERAFDGRRRIDQGVNYELSGLRTIVDADIPRNEFWVDTSNHSTEPLTRDTFRNFLDTIVTSPATHARITNLTS